MKRIMIHVFFSFVMLCGLLSLHAQAQVYKYIDNHGKVYVTNQLMGKGYHLVSSTRLSAGRLQTTAAIASKKGGFNVETFRANVMRYSPTIDRMAKWLKLDASLLHAIVYVESSYNAKALSRSGAQGLMQLMPATAKRFGVHDSWNPEENVRGGALYLSYLLDLFDYDLTLAIAAYNAGEGAVKRHGSKIPPYPETQRYVKKVLKRYQYLRRLG
ncbi:MAG: transglycosylase SLT domain-containing protein [Mariprofundaceae bacterium]|nr:transglycosylase SLT domain-containing protein [Mariprofundaceae bacterium]